MTKKQKNLEASEKANQIVLEHYTQQANVSRHLLFLEH
jgi:hypothetical protein